VYSLLQKMGIAMRREAINNSMQQEQRLALEAHIVSLKKGARTDGAAKTKVGGGGSGGGGTMQATGDRRMLALRDKDDSSEGGSEGAGAAGDVRRQRGRGGICKSADGGKVYGYFAKVNFNNVIFTTRIHKQLADAVTDHIIMMRTVEHIRCDENADKTFVPKVRFAVAAVLADEAIAERDFLRSVAVTFSAHHWIGRGLAMHFGELGWALEAWERLNHAQGPRLFAAGHPTVAYTPQRSERQWSHLKQVFVELQVQNGMQRDQVEGRLAHMEAAHRPTFVKKVAAWRRQEARGFPGNKAQKIDPAKATLRRFEKAIWAWNLEIAKHKRQTKLAEYRTQKRQENLKKKRRWDGKESLEDFKRRAFGKEV